MLLNSKWILYQTGEPKSADSKYGNPAAYFRREFTLNKRIRKGTLSVSALGVFRVYVNGALAADDYLAPGWVDYTKKLPLVEYDVTHLLSQENAVGVILGDGWAVGHIGSNYTFKRNNYTDCPEFTATVKIEYEDGTIDTVITDESWKAACGEILYDDIYMGEYVDHRKSLGEFSRFGYDDSGWAQAEVPVFKFSRNLYLDKVLIPPIRVKHVLRPSILSKKENRILYDVGQNIAGVLRCTVKGESGAKIVLRHGEMLKDGALYTENLRKAEATDTYILSGEETETFRPIFTYHGFQYAEIEITGKAELIDVVAEAMYTDLPVAGEFNCSDPLVNKIYENTLWGQRDNFMSVPTDCPQRDERLGWTGDAQIFCQSAMYNMDCKAYYEKYLADIRDAQLGNGVIPAVAPLPHVGSYAYTGRDCAAGWSEAIAEIPYLHYKTYGDKRVLRDNLPALKRLLTYYEADSKDFLRDGNNMYGDWLCIGEKTDLNVIANLYYAHAADLAAKICKILGDDEEPLYRSLFHNVRTAFRMAYVTQDGKILSDTQTAYALAYAFGILNEEEAKPHLIRKVEEADRHLTTGFLGVKYLLPVLCEFGAEHLAYEIITQRTYPGWGYSIRNGATTVWEHWDSYTAERGFLPGMNSFNHYSLGSCVEWMYEYCLGLRQPENSYGFQKVILRPYFDPEDRITSAEGKYVTPYGEIKIQWKKEGSSYRYRVEAPERFSMTFDSLNKTVLESKSDKGMLEFLLK